MANIVTVFVRLVAKPGVSLAALDDKRIVEMLLGDTGSYCVAVWHSAPRDGPVWDFQFGRRWSPGTGAEDVFLQHLEHLDTIWVRWADEGSDSDQIGYITHGWDSLQDRRDCRYQFDTVEVTWAEGHRPDPALGFRSGWLTTDAKWRLASPGTYLALNNRHDFSSEVPRLPSPTTPVESIYSSFAHVECAQLVALRPDLNASAEQVDYFFRGRLVHREQRHLGRPSAMVRSRLVHFYLDDWDNLADPDYLQKMNMPGPAILNP